jgi:hypothetical protein
MIVHPAKTSQLIMHKDRTNLEHLVLRLMEFYLLFSVILQVSTAGIGDILIGLTAIPIAYCFKRAYRLATNVSIIWNLLGIIDLGGSNISWYY